MPATNQNETYNGFSTATVNGIPNQLLMCDDYDDTTYMPSSSNMIFDYSTLTGPDSLHYVMFAKSKYDEAAVLTYELATALNPSASTIADYQYALWNLMNPNVSLVPCWVTEEEALQTSALTMVNNAADAKFLANTVYAYTEVYTPTAAYVGNQEFMQYETPEPNLAWPAGFLLLLAVVGIKVRQSSQRVRL